MVLPVLILELGESSKEQTEVDVCDLCWAQRCFTGIIELVHMASYLLYKVLLGDLEKPKGGLA